MDQTVGPWASKTGSGLELNTTGAVVTVGTNLGKNFHVSEALLKKPEGLLRLYSVTAL